MRASRLVSLLLLLQTRGRMTAAQLAEVLEVSVRTIYRDLEALSAAGVPVYAEAGPNGGCQLIDGYRTRLTGLTAKEAEALFASGVAGPVGELGFGTVLGAAQLKLLAALPEELADSTSTPRVGSVGDATSPISSRSPRQFGTTGASRCATGTRGRRRPRPETWNRSASC